MYFYLFLYFLLPAYSLSHFLYQNQYFYIYFTTFSYIFRYCSCSVISLILFITLGIIETIFSLFIKFLDKLLFRCIISITSRQCLVVDSVAKLSYNMTTRVRGHLYDRHYIYQTVKGIAEQLRTNLFTFQTKSRCHYCQWKRGYCYSQPRGFF